MFTTSESKRTTFRNARRASCLSCSENRVRSSIGEGQEILALRRKVAGLHALKIAYALNFKVEKLTTAAAI